MNPSPADPPEFCLLPLGGYGEFGRNATLLVQGDLQQGPAVLIDCGGKFAGVDLPGVDLLLPDLDLIESLGSRLQAYVVTHGHEDHIAALPYCFERCPAPIYAPRYALEMIRARFAQRGLEHARLHRLEPGRETACGPFVIEGVSVSHSIPDSMAIALRFGGCQVVASGDFRDDPNPVSGPSTDLARLEQLGDGGVHVLLADSTGATEAGHNPGEVSVYEPLLHAVRGATQRVVVATFSSHVHRLQQLMDVAAACGRQVVLLGRSAMEHGKLGLRLGELSPPPGLLVSVDEAIALPPSRLLAIATGCQGEPRAALARMARGDPSLPPLAAGDRVLLSARVIPGNDIALLKVANAIAQRGVELIWGDTGIHASGHGMREDLRLLIQATRPNLIIPAHGDRLHLLALANLANELHIGDEQTVIFENGQPLAAYRSGSNWHLRALEPINLGDFHADGKKSFELSSYDVAARCHASEHGMLAIAVDLDPQRHVLNSVHLRLSGVSHLGGVDLEAQLVEALDKELRRASKRGGLDPKQLEERCLAATRRVFRKRMARAPQLLVIAIER